MGRFVFILALMLLQGLILGQSSHARMEEYLQYSSLPMAEKKKIVKETMKLVVSLEAKYRFESLKKNPNQSKLKKYTYLLEKAQSFLIGSAHAASSYSQRFQDFTTLLQNPDKCIYGGWISQMRDGYCTHPMNLGNNAPERRAYTGQGCRSPQEISCNPLIFGHKKKDQNSLFCVPAGRSDNNAHNSSLRCMQKALSEEGDGQQKRLEDLAAEIQANPAQASALFEFISKACVCEAELPGLNENYHRYMRPHRTCVGLMKMLASSSNECAVPPVLGDNHALIQSLGTMIIPTYEAGNESQVDEYYVSFLADLRKSQEFKNFCANDDFSDEDNSGNEDSSSGSDGNSSGSGNTSGATSGSTSGATSGATSGSTAGAAAGSTSGASSGSTSGSTAGDEDGGQGLQSADPDNVDPGTTSGGSSGTPSGTASGVTDGTTNGSAGGPGETTPESSAGSEGGSTLVATEDPLTPTATSGGSTGDTGVIPPVGATSGGSTGTTPSEGPGNEDGGTGEEANSPISITVKKLGEDDSVARLEATTDPVSLPDGVIIVWFAKGESLPESDPQSADPDVKDNDAPVTEVPTPLAPIDLTDVNLGKDELEVEGQKRYSLTNRMITVDKIDGSYQMCAKLVKDGIIVANESCQEINGDDADDDVQVTSEEEGSPGKRKYKITVTPSGSSPVNLEVEIIDDKLDDGATIHWIKRTPKEKKKARPGEASSDEEPKEEEDTISLDEAKKSEIKDTEGKDSIKVDPEDSKIEVCAVIYENGNQASNVACSTIEKKAKKEEKENKRPAGPFMPQGPQGPPMMPLPRGSDMMIRGVY